ncbi:LamB/YcsF [Meira miltonrushii]|uniref:LamB/YcsF n=1 Tax=Meira miltonrushii TaxID=1280837 RepID=A0A316VAL9_9BASI|nr:LamB/YcsF [Meira miltonrushii]PWN34566.1 LamB/YcsF [Meira miltonrushii]
MATNPLKKIELNCDMGESLGRWILADDEAIMPHIDACNIAAGFHASDPTTIHKTVRLAKKDNIQIGAHPGFGDLVGFGRRTMLLSPEEVADLITYQAGAVQAFCQRQGVTMSHIKPHGALYFYLLSDQKICTAAVEAIKAFNVPMYGLPNSIQESTCASLGVPFVPEIFVDIEYSAEGNLIPPAKSKPISPEECAERVRMAFENDHLPAQQPASATTTKPLNLKGKHFSVCLHSDFKAAVDNVKAVRQMIDSINNKNV